MVALFYFFTAFEGFVSSVLKVLGRFRVLVPLLLGL